MSTDPRPPARFRLTLVPLPDPDGVPAWIRLRRLLKFALRYLGLRCQRIEELPEDKP